MLRECGIGWDHYGRDLRKFLDNLRRRESHHPNTNVLLLCSCSTWKWKQSASECKSKSSNLWTNIPVVLRCDSLCVFNLISSVYLSPWHHHLRHVHMRSIMSWNYLMGAHRGEKQPQIWGIEFYARVWPPLLRPYLWTAGRRTLPGTVGSCLRVWQRKCQPLLSACWCLSPRHPGNTILELRLEHQEVELGFDHSLEVNVSYQIHQRPSRVAILWKR